MVYIKYCDICGQKIPEAPDLRPRQGQFEIYDPGIAVAPQSTRWDLCIECANEAKVFLQDLKMKRGGKTVSLSG